MNHFKNKNFLILGGTSGIGFDLAKKLSAFSKVAVIGRNDKNIKSFNSKNITFFRHEISDLDNSIEFFNTHIIGEKYDGVFVSVGTEQFKSLSSIKNRDIKNIFLPPILALLIILKLATSGKLLNELSSIVAMSSVSSVKGSAAMSVYGSSRAAIESIIKHSSNELTKRKIRINAIRSGAFKTEMHQRITSKMKKKQLEIYEKSHLLGFGEIDDVTELVIYLLSSKSKWFTGSVITLDGGYLSS